MFWKRIEKSKKPTYSFSIVRRLTALSTLSSALILVLSIGFLYWTLQDNLEKKDAKFLIGEVFEMQTIFSEIPYDWEAIEQEVKGEEITGSKFNQYYLRLLDNQHHILNETPGMTGIVPTYVFPEPENIKGQERGKEWSAEGGASFLLISAWINGTSKEKEYVLQAAINISQDEVLLNDYRNKIILVFLLAIIISGEVNILVTKRGMQPLKDITDKVQQITASQLHERIQAEKWPKELSILATAFDEMLDRLEDSFTRLSQFSVNLAHELRTPINNLVGEAQVAISKARTAEEYKEILESSLEEYSRLSRVIDSLLFLARSENKEIKLDLVSFDAKKEIEAVVDFYDAFAQEKGISVSCKGEGLVQADTILFRRLINNLLANALQYTPRGGTVTISVQPIKDQGAEIIVKDTGIGIDENDLPQLFNRFFRTKSARLQYPQGMGLGLHIVKSIMTLHGGTVTLRSVLSQGTTVTLNFPQS